MTGTHSDENAQPDVLERKLQLLDELGRLESEQKKMGTRLSRAFVPAFLFAGLAFFVRPPIWMLLCIILVLLCIPVAYILSTKEGRASRANWRRIQELKRELRFVESFGHFSDEHRSTHSAS